MEEAAKYHLTPPVLRPLNVHEIQYRSDSTNLDALSGFAKLAAEDRRELLDHIEAQREAFRQALAGLLGRGSWTEGQAALDTGQSEHDYRIRVAAKHLGIDL